MLKLEHVVSCKENSVMKAVVLEENSKELPDDTELRLYAESLGIDPDAEPDLLWIAREGISASLPKGWQVLQDENNQIFYYNSQTGASLWEHPLDQRFRQRVSLARRRCTGAGGDLSTAVDGEHQNTLAQSVDNTKARNKLRSQHQLVCNSNRLPMGNDDWKSTPLLGDEVVPASTTTVAKAAAGDGDDMTTTEYCTLVVPPPGNVSLRPSLLVSRDCQNGQEEEATRQHQSNTTTTAVACQTQSEGKETQCPTRPTSSAAASYLVDLDRADRTLARLRSSLRRDYLTLDESSSSKGLSVLLTGGDLTAGSRRLVLRGDSIEQQQEHSSAVKSTPATAGQQLPAGRSFVPRADLLSPLAARSGNIRCPIVGTSPSEANESDGLGVGRQQPGYALVRQPSSSPGSSVHGTRGNRGGGQRQSLLASADRHEQQQLPHLATLRPTSTLVNVCQHDRPSCGGGGGSAVLQSQQHTTTPRCHDYNCQPGDEEQSDGDDGLQEKRQRLRLQESFAVKDACGHLLEERSRLERKLMRLRLIYKTYKQRLANLDASIQLLHNNSQSAPATSPDSCYGNGTRWSREKRFSPPNWAYKQQVSVILADQVSETAAASHFRRRLGVQEQDEDDGDEGESRRRSSSVPRHSTGCPVAESMQSCSCCRLAQGSSVWPDESLDHRLANLTLTGDQSRPSGLPHRPIVVGGRCAGRQVVVDDSPPAVVDRSGDNIRLLASVSPAPRDLGRFQEPCLDVSPTWQQSD